MSFCNIRLAGDRLIVSGDRVLVLPCLPQAIGFAQKFSR
jgi:hypothetical protein